MDTHSRNKKHQAEAASDNAGPVPETRPDLTGIIWQKESGKRTSRFFLADENATENFGRLLGKLAADGDVYCLSGDLGAGKTLMSKGVCQAVGVEEEDVVRATCGYGCIACSECVRACPKGAVSIIDNHAVIDYTKCAGCEACTVKCKKKIIVDTLHDLTKIKEKVAFVRCSGGKKAQEKYKSMGIQSCEEAAKQDAKALGLCTTVCLGQGSCTAVCRYDAISIVNGTAYVDPDKCVGCRDCTFACPKGLITIVPYMGMKQVPCSSTDDYADKRKVCDSACVACGDCKANCPNGAIYMEERHAVVDPELCENCNMCQYVCTYNVIREQSVPEYIYAQRDALKNDALDNEGAEEKGKGGNL